MALHKDIRNWIKRYSFVKDVTFRFARVNIYYEKEGKTKKKSLPYRATKEQLISCIDRIKEDIDYENWRLKEDSRISKEVKEDDKKESAFAFSD